MQKMTKFGDDKVCVDVPTWQAKNQRADFSNNHSYEGKSGKEREYLLLTVGCTHTSQNKYSLPLPREKNKVETDLFPERL